MIGIDEIRAHGDRTRARIHAGIDGGDLAFEVAARIRHAGRVDLVAGAQRSQLGFGHLEIHVHALDVIQRGDRGAGGDQRTGADLADAQHAGERRTHPAVADVGLHFAHAGISGIADGALRVQRGAGHQLLGGEFALALVQLVGLQERGLGLQQRGFLGLAAQGNQRRAGTDLLATFEVHRLDDFADLGGDRHRLARLGRAQCLQRVAPCRSLHHLGGDRYGVCLPASGLVFTATPSQSDQGDASGEARCDASQHVMQSRLFLDRRVYRGVEPGHMCQAFTGLFTSAGDGRRPFRAGACAGCIAVYRRMSKCAARAGVSDPAAARAGRETCPPPGQRAQ
ncbi:hypothetical protein D3C71_1312550 [compost metagenome]